MARPRPGRAGSVSLIFAASALPLIIAAAVAVDASRIATAEANLQEAADNAALTGAAAYSINAQAAQTKAVVTATSSFCEATARVPAGFSLTGAASTPCVGSGAAGPTVKTQIGGFQTGTPGIVSSGCSASKPIVGGGITCGFIVTVSGQATMTTMVSAIFGVSRTIYAIAIAANPFIDIGSAISAQINGSARNTNSVWVYPLLLNANGDPDYTTNAGAIPGLPSGCYAADASPSYTTPTSCGTGTPTAGTPAGLNCASNPASCNGAPQPVCNDSPVQFTCGVFTMLASTYYDTPACSPCNPLGAGTYPTIYAGVIQNPQAPASIITATTPLGIAFESHAGGNSSYGPSGQPNPSNGCYYPGNTVYSTVAQLFSNATNTFNGSVTAGNQGIDWPKVTHWFYSSYLANGLPPSEGEILSQSQLFTYKPPGGGASITYNARIPSVGSDASGDWSPSLLACSQPAGNGNSYDKFLTTSYPSSGATNASLFILSQPSGSAYIQPASTGDAYQRYTPQATPGARYGALSCQSYGQKVFTFYWNDMGGNAAYGDDLDYNNGTVQISCSAPTLIKLIG